MILTVLRGMWDKKTQTLNQNRCSSVLMMCACLWNRADNTASPPCPLGPSVISVISSIKLCDPFYLLTEEGGEIAAEKHRKRMYMDTTAHKWERKKKKRDKHAAKIPRGLHNISLEMAGHSDQLRSSLSSDWLGLTNGPRPRLCLHQSPSAGLLQQPLCKKLSPRTRWRLLRFYLKVRKNHPQLERCNTSFQRCWCCMNASERLTAREAVENQEFTSVSQNGFKSIDDVKLLVPLKCHLLKRCSKKSDGD